MFHNILRPPSFDDFKEMFPVIGRSLQSLLDYDGDDFDEKFGLNFTVSAFNLREGDSLSTEGEMAGPKESFIQRLPCRSRDMPLVKRK